MAKVTLKELRKMAREVLDEQINEMEQKLLGPKAPVKVHDGFRNVESGVERLRVLLQMYDSEIPHRVETSSAAFTDIVHGIVREAFSWLEEGLGNIAREYSDLTYESMVQHELETSPEA